MASYDNPTHMGSTGVDWDAANRNRDNQQLQILAAAAKLDPELQALVLQRLGIVPQRKPLSYDGLSPTDALMIQQGRMQHPGSQPRIMGPQGRQLEMQRQLYEMKGGEREQKQQLQEAKLQALVERYQALAQQFQQKQMLDVQKQQLAQQAEQRRGATAQNPAAPFATALKEIEAAARGGADPQTLQAMIEGMGYQPTGSKRVGGFLGMGGTQVPTIGLRRPQTGSASPQSETQARVVVQKDGKRASLPVSQLEEAQKQGWALIQ